MKVCVLGCHTSDGVSPQLSKSEGASRRAVVLLSASAAAAAGKEYFPEQRSLCYQIDCSINKRSRVVRSTTNKRSPPKDG